MRISSRALLPLVVAWGAAVAYACSATKGSDDEASSSPSGPSGEGNPSGGIDLDAGTGGGSSGGGTECVPCSADLHKVLDCDGAVKKECPPEQACAGGECIDDPCEAARLSKSTYGCDYWALNTDAITEQDPQTGKVFGAGSCWAVFVANTWTLPVHIEVERGAQSFDVASFARIPSGQGQSIVYGPYDAAAGLAPGEVAILFLAHSPDAVNACPAGVVPAVIGNTAVHGTARGQAFHITTDLPVVSYQIFPYGGGNTAAPSATLLLPTSAWDVNYMVVNPYDFELDLDLPDWLDAGSFTLDTNSLAIVAATDGTQVLFNPVADITAGAGVAGSPAGQSVQYDLARGEYLQITQPAELTGSVLLANQPVGLFGAATCMNIPVAKAACDIAHQQIPPIKALGHEYVGVRYRGRKAMPDEPVPWRIVGAVDGTKLSYTPSAPPGAPSEIQLGEKAVFWSPGPFVVTSQDKEHPFYLGAYMTGGGPLGGYGTDPDPTADFGGEGDPEWVNVVPGDQYLDSYVFFTDPTFPETNLVVTRVRGKDGNFAEVTLDCLGAVTGWQPVGDRYEWTRVDLVTGNYQNVGGCSNGRHTLKSDLPVGLTVWGWGSQATGANLQIGDPGYTQYASYAYPAGESVRPINIVVVEPPPVPK